jgi:hypothetical protein
MAVLLWVCGALVAAGAGLLVWLWPARRTGRHAGRRPGLLPAVGTGVARGVAAAPVQSRRYPGQPSAPLAETRVRGGELR